MEAAHKQLYEAPTTEVVEFKYEGLICLSGDREGYDLYEI